MPVELNVEEIIMAVEGVMGMQSGRVNKSGQSTVVGGLTPGNYEMVLMEAKEQSIQFLGKLVRQFPNEGQRFVPRIVQIVAKVNE